MPVDFKRAQKPARKLRKLIKRMPAEPTPEQVHDFRTNTRKMEAILQAFALDRSRIGHRLLKPLVRLRKRAGKLRDMDVLTSYATSVRPDAGEQDCAVQLLEFLGAQRGKYARRFHAASRQDGSKLRQHLKQAQRKLGSKEAKTQEDGRHLSEPSSSALDAGSELARFARLNRSNLHPFRLKVKELRNVLRLAQNPDEDLVDALGKVKDAIGEWHDWEELVGIAHKILDHGARCKLIQQLKAITREKYETAVSEARQLRKRYLGISDNRQPTRLRAPAPGGPVARAAIKLVA